jgi:hypothetical protein
MNGGPVFTTMDSMRYAWYRSNEQKPPPVLQGRHREKALNNDRMCGDGLRRLSRHLRYEPQFSRFCLLMRWKLRTRHVVATMR